MATSNTPDTTAQTVDVNVARSALSQALGVLAPLTGAMQNAATVFDQLSNATVYKAALEKSVAELDALITMRQTQLSELIVRTEDAGVRAVNAETAATQAIADAEAMVAPKVAEYEAILAQQLTDWKARNDAKAAEISAHVDAINEQANKDIADITAKAVQAQADYDAISKKLESVKANAAKFAASLQG
jgi:chromosome segregation ATPase